MESSAEDEWAGQEQRNSEAHNGQKHKIRIQISTKRQQKQSQVQIIPKGANKNWGEIKFGFTRKTKS